MVGVGGRGHRLWLGFLLRLGGVETAEGGVAGRFRAAAALVAL